MKSEEILNKFTTLNDDEKLNFFKALLSQKDDEIYRLEELITYYKSLIFGKKSEKNKVDPNQISLFNELELEEAIGELESTVEVIGSYKRKKPGTKNLVNEDNNFPIEIVEHKLEDTACPTCSNTLTEYGYDIKRELCVVPAKYFIKEHRYFKYKCEKCGMLTQVERDITAFPNSMYSSSLVSKFIYDKFALSLPLYRQEKAYQDLGINITRSNMTQYLSRTCELFKPLYDKYAEILKSEDIVHSDETRLKILSIKNESGNVKTNYVWLFRSSRSSNKQITFYYYNDGRKYHNVTDFFANDTEQTRYIIADGYGAYEALS